MEGITLDYKARARAAGARKIAIVGVVASGNLEVLAERVLPEDECLLEIRTASQGFAELWDAVGADFIERYSPGGIRFSINDGGARPDTVSLRLAQAARVIQEEALSAAQAQKTARPAGPAAAASWCRGVGAGTRPVAAGPRKLRGISGTGGA